ncbi:ELMD3 protein, partial [Nothocercus nigrocapillus]|nr:ELMD3 protein [Nothocercus nigrocapillus]
ISFEEALQYFQGAELDGCRKKVQAPPRRRGLAALLHVLFGPPRLQAPLRAERDLALAITHCALDDRERVHVRILQTIYRSLTRSALACPRYGTHWEELGFQGAPQGRRGATPAPEAASGSAERSGASAAPGAASPEPAAVPGCVGFSLVNDSFPFCLMSLNITHIVVRALRDGRLSRECRRRQQVLAVLNDVHAGAFLRLSRGWTARRGTLADAGALLQELETFTKKKPKQLLKSLETYLSG